MVIIKANLWITRRFRYNLEEYKDKIARQLLVLTLQKVNVKLPSSLDYKARIHSYKECLLSKWWSNQGITILWGRLIIQNNSLKQNKQKPMKGLELFNTVEGIIKRTYIYLIFKHLLTPPTPAWCMDQDLVKFNLIKMHRNKWIIEVEEWMWLPVRPLLEYIKVVFQICSSKSKIKWVVIANWKPN